MAKQRKGDIMFAQYEERPFDSLARVWLARYESLENIAHWHKECELIYVEEGEAIIAINSIRYDLLKGNLLFVNSGDIHYIRSSQDSVMAIIIFDSMYISEIDNYEMKGPLKSHNFIDLFQMVNDEIREKEEFYEKKIHAYLLGFMVDIMRQKQAFERKSRSTGNYANLYQKLLEYLDENYADVTFEDASKIMGFSNSHFSKVFSTLSGTTFTKFLNAVRVEKSLDLLKENNLAIYEIAYSSGFSSVRHFNRVFKHLTGITPKEVTSSFKFTINPTKLKSASFDPTLPASKLISTKKKEGRPI